MKILKFVTRNVVKTPPFDAQIFGIGKFPHQLNCAKDVDHEWDDLLGTSRSPIAMRFSRLFFPLRLWWLDSIVRIVVCEIGKLPHRISASLEIRSRQNGPGLPIAAYPWVDGTATDDEASAFLTAYTRCMEKLMREHRSFGDVEIQICNQAFHEGAKFQLHNIGTQK